MKAAILGTTGYTGMVLSRILADHSEVTEVLPGSSSQAGEKLEVVDPGLGTALSEKSRNTGGKLLSVEQIVREKPDVVFSALPHLTSAEVCAPFFGTSVVVDLSADFRIRDAGLFRKAYKEEPPRPELLEKAVYGLCEIYRSEIKRSDLIANPGCYPTATLLPVLPLARAGAIRGRVLVNALSGISGAGRKTSANYLYVERDENSGAYNPGSTHRHHAEMAEQIHRADRALDLLFTPHLVPLSRGMAATIAVELVKELDDAAIEKIYRDAYDGCPFVRITPGRIPQTKDVLASNRCDLSWHREGGILMLFSVIDNLGKGASGQAVQNMNIRFGFPETSGLRTYGEL